MRIDQGRTSSGIALFAKRTQPVEIAEVLSKGSDVELLVAHREVVNPSERFVDRALRNGHPRAKRLEIAIDRIFLQTHVPKLQSVRSGVPVSASTTRAEIHRWAKANGIPVRYLAKGDNKEKIAERLLRAAAEEGGDGKVVLIGIA